MQCPMLIKTPGQFCCMLATLFAFTVHVAPTWGSQTADSPVADGSAAAKTQKRIDAMIEQLGDPSFIKREGAKEELEKFGLLAFESLREAEMHPNVEISHSATYLLESMQVDWSLPTDSFDVQNLLKDYNDSAQRTKLESLQRLASLERLDAYMALLRLMRYEKDEKISKVAGLHVMECAIDSMRLRSEKASSDSAAKVPWQELISAGAAESTRVTAKWLQTLAKQLNADAIDVQPWQKHVTQERKLLESNARERSQLRTKTDDEIVKRLYRVVAKLMAVKGQLKAAIDFFEPCFELVPREQQEAFSDLQWMLEAGLPQAVERLNEQRPELFASRSRNRYLLAEAYLKLEQLDKANKTAAEARDLTTLSPELAKRIAQAHLADSEAMQRYSNFDYLLQRGLFDWGEAELKRILARADRNELSIQQELATRQRLSTFYWAADQPDLAAEVWKPLMRKAGWLEESPAEPPGKDLLNELMQRNSDDIPYSKYIPSHYYFYQGLQASKKEDWELARKQLQKAAEYDASDPDLLIAMYHATQADKQFEKLVDQYIEKLEAGFRVDLEKAESDLASARNGRSSYENIVAVYCNQLAWLLSCTHRKLDDAITLSQRACNLSPDSGVYLDTLARCHFSAGNIDKAIQLQTQAIKMTPYERSMLRQLDEFKAAKK